MNSEVVNSRKFIAHSDSYRANMRKLVHQIVSLIWCEGALSASKVFDEACKLIILTELLPFEIDTSTFTISNLKVKYQALVDSSIRALLGDDLQIMQYQIPHLIPLVKRLDWGKLLPIDRYEVLLLVYEESVSARDRSVRSVVTLSQRVVALLCDIIALSGGRSLLLSSLDGAKIAVSLAALCHSFNVGVMSSNRGVDAFIRKSFNIVWKGGTPIVPVREVLFDVSFVNLFDAYFSNEVPFPVVERQRAMNQLLADSRAFLRLGGTLICVVPRYVAAADVFIEFRRGVEKDFRLVSLIEMDTTLGLGSVQSPSLLAVFCKGMCPLKGVSQPKLFLLRESLMAEKSFSSDKTASAICKLMRDIE